MTAGTASRLGFEVWLFVLVGFAGTTLLWTQPTLRLGALLLFALPVLAWSVARVRGPLELLDLTILAGIGAHLVVSLMSMDRESSLEASAIVAVYAAVYWLARRVGADPTLQRTASIAIVMALTFWLVVIGLTWVAEKVADVQAFGWPPRLDAHQAYAWGSINTPPALLLLAAPFAAWLPSRGLRRVFLGVLAAAAIAVIPFSVGRAAWVGIAVAILALEGLSGFPVIGRARRMIVARGAEARAAAALAIGVVGILAVWLVIGRGDAIGAALDSRVRLWQQAAALFGNDPLTGSGPTTFAWARLAHVPDFTDRVGASAAHNVPVQTLADGGLLLGVAMLLIVGAWAWRVVTGRRRLDGRQRTAVAALTGFGAFSLLDDLSFLPAVTILVIVLAAWALPTRDEDEVSRTSSRVPSLIVPAVLVLVAVATAPTVISLGMMRIGLAEARAAAVNGDWDAALLGFQSAARAQPSNALHWMSIGLAESRLGRDDAAANAYRTASQLSPGDPRPWGALAVLGTGTEEIDPLLEAARRSNDPQYAYRLASALVAQGAEAEAAGYFAIASVIQPLLYAGVPEPMRSRVRAEMAEAIATVGSLQARDPLEVEWNVALEANEVHDGAPIQWDIARHVDADDGPAASMALAEARQRDAHALRTWEAASAVARLTCDVAALEEADANVELLGREEVGADHRVAERRPGLYREPDLGDYQPLRTPSLPAVPQWPLAFVEVPDCGW